MRTERKLGTFPFHRTSYRTSEVTISCWRLSWWERLYGLLRGRVWVYVYGQQPPMSVGGGYPFVRSAEEVYMNDKCPVNCQGCNADRCCWDMATEDFEEGRKDCR